jgi:hypothetical protein
MILNLMIGEEYILSKILSLLVKELVAQSFFLPKNFSN